jgi:hypothetical protein
MAGTKLWIAVASSVAGLLVVPLVGCRGIETPIGMSLLFQCAGNQVVVQRFDPDGQRGPVPGSVGAMYPKGGAIMSFMPGDSKRVMPQFVDVAWVERTAEFTEWVKMDTQRPRKEQYSPAAMAEYKIAWAKQPHHTRRVDLRPILTPELLAQVRKDYRGTQLKLIITFNNEQVDIKAEAYKWN